MLYLLDDCFILILLSELVETNACKLQPSLSERVIVDGYGCHTALHFGVISKENQDKVFTLYWLPKLHKNHIKYRTFRLLTLCLTVFNKLVIKYCEKLYETSGKNLFWSIKNSGEI